MQSKNKPESRYKIYGYSLSDALGLIEFLKDRNNQTLTKSFSEYARSLNKATGTVRNLYYAVARKSREDQEFCQRFLQGKPLAVGRIEGFSQKDEQELIEKILEQKIKGRSVRSTIMEMSNGDVKRALRYQNKYRNAIKKNPDLIDRVAREKLKDGQGIAQVNRQEYLDGIEDLNRAKDKIRKMLDKAMGDFKKEKSRLQLTITKLEKENAILKSQRSIKG